jgi:hypothetical protein
MKTPLRLTSNNNPALLQQIPIDIGSCNAPIGRKANPHKLSEPTRVIIPLRLRIPKCLEDGIGLENLALKKAEAAFGC